MSKLEELIEELCPEGVEYKKLKECTEMKRGTSATKSTLSEGKIPVISGGREPAFYCDTYNRDGETITVAGSGAGAGYVQYWNIPIFVNDAFSIKGNEGVDTKYIYHYLLNIQEQIYATKKGGGVPHVHVSSIENFTIPIPPLPVQEEIVRILDNFTNLTAELQARAKQYEYYRDTLLTFGDDVSKVKLADIIKSSCSGATPTKGKTEYYEGGTIPWLRTQDVKFNEITETDSYITELAVQKTGAKWIPENCVIVAISGATAGRCAINKFKTTTNQHCLNMEIDEAKALYKYVFYCVCNSYEDLISKKQGARGDLNSSIVKGLEIYLPSLEEQKQIVHILDNFNNLVNDINDGLPAEIEARQKQYEYYRNKLLTFKELGA